MVVRIRRARILAALLICFALLLAASIAVRALAELTEHDHLMGFSGMFDFSQEANMPTWFSGFLLGLCALILLLLYAATESKKTRYHWLALACIFLFLSADEVAQIHEHIGRALKILTDVENLLPTEQSPAWVFWGGAFSLLIAVVFWRFWWQLARGVRSLILCAALLYVGGALGFELIETWYIAARGITAGVYVLITLEESMEMLGIIVLLMALLRQLQGALPTTQFEIC